MRADAQVAYSLSPIYLKPSTSTMIFPDHFGASFTQAFGIQPSSAHNVMRFLSGFYTFALIFEKLVWMLCSCPFWATSEQEANVQRWDILKSEPVSRRVRWDVCIEILHLESTKGWRSLLPIHPKTQSLYFHSSEYEKVTFTRVIRFFWHHTF